MLVSKYYIGFLEWAKHTSMLYPIEHEMVQGFIRGLALPLFLASEHLIVDGSTFVQVVNH